MPGRLPPAYVDALHAYEARLRARFGPRLCLFRVFGSHARGEAHADSDLDVAVVIVGLSGDERRAAIDDAAEVELEKELLLAPFVVSAEHFDHLVHRELAIARAVLREGFAP